jgi:FHA domain
MAQCPRCGTVVDLKKPTVPKKCSCLACGSWIYPHLLILDDQAELVEYREEGIFGRADVRGSHGANGISRNHARFYPTEEGWNLVSLSSRNASEVNGKTVATLHTVVLRDGDRLKFGTLAFSVKFKRPPL